MYVYVYVCMWVVLEARLVHVKVYSITVCMYMYICVYVCMHVYMGSLRSEACPCHHCMHVCVCQYICMCVCVSTYTYVEYIHAHAHTQSEYLLVVSQVRAKHRGRAVIN